MKNSSYRKLYTGRILPGILVSLLVVVAACSDNSTNGPSTPDPDPPNPNPPDHPVRLIFIHHSTGENCCV